MSGLQGSETPQNDGLVKESEQTAFQTVSMQQKNPKSPHNGWELVASRTAPKRSLALHQAFQKYS